MQDLHFSSKMNCNNNKSKMEGKKQPCLLALETKQGS